MSEKKGEDFAWSAEKDRLEQLRELLFAINEELQGIETEIAALPRQDRDRQSESYLALKGRQRDALRRFKDADTEHTEERQRRGMT